MHIEDGKHLQLLLIFNLINIQKSQLPFLLIYFFYSVFGVMCFMGIQQLYQSKINASLIFVKADTIENKYNLPLPKLVTLPIRATVRTNCKNKLLL